MSTYKDLCRSSLPGYIQAIADWFEGTLKDCTLNMVTLRYCLILLYEYCICYAYFKVCPDSNTIDSANINLKHLKVYCRSIVLNDTFSKPCFRFYTLRNHLAHLTDAVTDTDEILLLLSNDLFFTVLTFCEIPGSIINILHDCTAILNSKNFDSVSYLKDFFGDNMSMLPAVYSETQITYDECLEIKKQFAYLKSDSK